jgi:agmatine deiminase
MKSLFLSAIGFLLVCCGSLQLQAQSPVLPHGYAPWELAAMDGYIPERTAITGSTEPPVLPVRAAAEWEEIDALMVAWTGFIPTVREIVRHAREECEVLIVCADSVAVKDDLLANGIELGNISYVDAPFNSVWIRDYGPWNVYTDQVDSLYLIDWIYNRPTRPEDDAIPGVIASLTDLPIYQSVEDPWDFVATGGNFMTDGLGTGFSSKLILEENDGTGQSQSFKSEAAIDSIMRAFMGIDRYIKMETLPYDEIHHIDMHMKLLDEETLLVGEYPEGVADGPQIEANLQYVLDNYMSPFGTPYKVVRIPMPPDASGEYPDDGPWWSPGDYRTYTNFVFVNKTVLVPTYEEQYDTTALRILDEHLPSYTIVGIDCNDIIQSLGAIHCITKEVATDDPLLITHQPLSNTEEQFVDYQVDAQIVHRDGISFANILYTTVETISAATIWYNIPMTLTDPETNTWTGYIPAQAAGKKISYYLRANASNGKLQYRPITAPYGYWRFEVEAVTTGLETVVTDRGTQLAPVPASSSINITSENIYNHYTISDFSGRVIQQGTVAPASTWSLAVQHIPAGLYLLHLQNSEQQETLQFMKQ